MEGAGVGVELAGTPRVGAAESLVSCALGSGRDPDPVGGA